MKLTLKAGGEVEVADMAQAHVMMADGVAVRQAIPDEDAPKAPKKAKKAKKAKK